jgi:hypothetical protein
VTDWVGKQACAGREARVGCTREKRVPWGRGCVRERLRE